MRIYKYYVANQNGGHDGSYDAKVAANSLTEAVAAIESQVGYPYYVTWIRCCDGDDIKDNDEPQYV
jgi:hypothetical protein